ncbi:MAG TPA: 3-keto-5-aminohexanoate cleavage protein [Actinomycetota bacterium]|nr:3-keto-5-aminohexanoate cleavage protein [Actinomycetota bacterium]
MLLQACLNGSRTSKEHPAIPRTPAELAAEGSAAVEAGAQVLHLHPYDESGAETFAAVPCAATLRAVRAACPGIPISLSTSEAIVPHPGRLEAIARWTELPELVTANQGEAGIVELCELLIARGVGIEAGLLHVDDAHSFVSSGLVDRCVRVLVEPLDAEPAAAVAHAEAMERVLADAGVSLEQVHHGDDIATWHVMARGLRRGHGTRAGLEDTTRLPDGQLAPDNAALVRLAAEMIRRASPQT